MYGEHLFVEGCSLLYLVRSLPAFSFLKVPGSGGIWQRTATEWLTVTTQYSVGISPKEASPQNLALAASRVGTSSVHDFRALSVFHPHNRKLLPRLLLPQAMNVSVALTPT